MKIFIVKLYITELPHVYILMGVIQPILNVLPRIPILFFLLAFAWQASVSFRLFYMEFFFQLIAIRLVVFVGPVIIIILAIRKGNLSFYI